MTDRRTDPTHISHAIDASLRSLIAACNESRRRQGLPIYDVAELAAESPRRRFGRLFGKTEPATGCETARGAA